MQAVTITQITYTELEQLIQNSIRREVSSLVKEKEEDTILTFEQGCEFLNLEKATVYGKTSRREIPFIKNGKHIRFSKADLITWLKSSSKKPKLQAA